MTITQIWPSPHVLAEFTSRNFTWTVGTLQLMGQLKSNLGLVRICAPGRYLYQKQLGMFTALRDRSKHVRLTALYSFVFLFLGWPKLTNWVIFSLFLPNRLGCVIRFLFVVSSHSVGFVFLLFLPLLRSDRTLSKVKTATKIPPWWQPPTHPQSLLGSKSLTQVHYLFTLETGIHFLKFIVCISLCCSRYRGAIFYLWIFSYLT